MRGNKSTAHIFFYLVGGGGEITFNMKSNGSSSNPNENLQDVSKKSKGVIIEDEFSQLHPSVLQKL